MNKPSIYYRDGYTCAEAMIKSYNEEHKINIPISLGSGMGVGMNVGSVCGAVNAAVLIIGYIKGRSDRFEQNDARKYTKKLITMVRTKYNSEMCVNLKRNKIGCDEILNFTYDALNELLKENNC